MAASIVDSLKRLAVKMKGSGTVSDIPGSSVSSVIDHMTEIYSGTGAKGEAGKSVKSIALTTNESGQVTGGTVTFDDESTASITVSQGGV